MHKYCKLFSLGGYEKSICKHLYMAGLAVTTLALRSPLYSYTWGVLPHPPQMEGWGEPGVQCEVQ